ncbi:prolipoprotein diacylglyceryl transferase [Treponema pedis]|uniref:Phosphatidylglycerol--prolipoprotein diacylglyceryl transferase n=1 Tax=Treponema pedis str. T A4 TaxID=1291379 RepID=S6A7T4_9SPIR|nr:prolipoprotein diacylglyceryl transferase [Treponema pedis]AGT42644.1 prolipoprotein diacylglyceryl transferase [Treponema pedis str. T A4]
MILAIKYPQWLKPEIIPGFPLLRWYGLMYLFAFMTAYFLYRYQVKKGEFEKYSGSVKTMSREDVIDVFFWGIAGLLLGARIFGTLVYNYEEYLPRPWLIFWPFMEDASGKWVFTGFQGISYHGGFIGGFLGVLLWAKKNKFNFAAVADLMAVSIPLGYTFGRFGNFANGELYGRITTSGIGMIFPQVPESDKFFLGEEWVRAFAEKAGIAVQEGASIINLPRHPSQLYEAFFEGIVLWAILWFLRKKKPFNGFLVCVYTLGYGLFRFFIEYFRQPDANMGYKISASGSTNIYIYESWKNISTGQIFCFIMIAGSIIAMAALAVLNKKSKNNG